MILDAAQQRLAELDATLRTAPEGNRTLNPVTHRPTSLVDLHVSLTESLAALGPDANQVFATGLASLVETIQRNFPENIFLDLDYLASNLVTEACELGSLMHLQESLDQIQRLQNLYGGATTIRFRYVHDFIYGFDWAKWVKKQPIERKHVRPFDRIFLQYLEERAAQLFALIEENDTKYHRLRHARHRNPFAFSREPDAEYKIHRHLAQRALIPVQTWQLQTIPEWAPSYAEERVRQANALGFGLPRPPRTDQVTQ